MSRIESMRHLYIYIYIYTYMRYMELLSVAAMLWLCVVFGGPLR